MKLKVAVRIFDLRDLIYPSASESSVKYY